MVNDAEKFKEEDEKIKAQVEAKNGLESFAYSLKAQLGDQEKLGGKVSEDEKAKMEEAIKVATDFVDNNPNASVEEFEAAKKELESVVQPIISKLYPEGAGQQGGQQEGQQEGGDEKDEL